MSSTQPEPAAAPQTGPLPYRLASAPVEVNRYDDRLNRVVTGYEVQVEWLANGSVFTVFIPNGQPLADTLDTLARAKGAELDALHAFAG